MRRLRSPVKGGYVRKTVSLPASLVRKIEAHLKMCEGVTISAFLTVAAEHRLHKDD